MEYKSNTELLDELLKATDDYSSKIKNIINLMDQNSLTKRIHSSFGEILLKPNEYRDFATTMRIELIFLYKRLKSQEWDFLQAKHFQDLEYVESRHKRAIKENKEK